jgi:hypothetical protein
MRPELQRFVEAARTQSIAGTSVTAESVQAGLEHSRRRSHGQRVLWLSGAIAIAASMLVAALVSPLWSRDREPETHASVASDSETNELITLGDGTHEIELVHEPGQPSAPLHIDLAGRTLELVEGRATIEVHGDDVAVVLHTGVAAWIGTDGQRTQIEVEHIAIDQAQLDSAAELAREADRLMAAGAHEQAIETLRRLVELYPQASQTRAAILDLARLLASLERERHARCAYELYLERWPDSSITAEVEAQLARLSAAECHGLEPR